MNTSVRNQAILKITLLVLKTLII